MENNKRPYIEQIVYVRVEKGDDAFYNKKDLRHDEISVCFFLQDLMVLTIWNQNKKQQGVCSSK